MSDEYRPGEAPVQYKPTRPPVTFSDLVDDLLWPKLLRAGLLALSPSRIALSFFTLVAILLIGSIGGMFENAYPRVAILLDGMWQSIKSFEPGSFFLYFRRLFFELPASLWTEYDYNLLLAIPIVLVFSIMGGAVCRSVATEFSLGIKLRWTDALAFAIARIRAFSLAIVGPALAILAIYVVLAVAGAILFNIPIINLFASFFYVLFMLLGLVASVLILGLVVGAPMLVPAVACEGTDSIDAAQRVLHYVLHTPLRLVLYIGVLAGVGLLAGLLVFLLADLVVTFTQGAMSVWVSSSNSDVFPPVWRLAPGIDHAGHKENLQLSGIESATYGVIGFWQSIPALIAASYVLSYIYTASTMLYLMMRQINDGQDHAELWVPGMIAGTMAESLRIRAEMEARHAQTGAPKSGSEDEPM